MPNADKNHSIDPKRLSMPIGIDRHWDQCQHLDRQWALIERVLRICVHKCPGEEITEKKPCLYHTKGSKGSTYPPLFLPVLDCAVIWMSENRQSSSLSFGKVPKIFTCPPQFLPDPDRQIVSNFHPWMSNYLPYTPGGGTDPWKVRVGLDRAGKLKLFLYKCAKNWFLFYMFLTKKRDILIFGTKYSRCKLKH